MLGGMCVTEELTQMASGSIAARARERQAAALRAAERHAQRAKKSRTRLAADLGLGYDQYARYVNGEAALRYEQTELFAHVYDIDKDVLGRALLTGDVREIESLAVETRTMRDELHGRIPEEDIPGFLEEHAGKPHKDQLAAGRGVNRTANRARSKASVKKPGQRRPA